MNVDIIGVCIYLICSRVACRNCVRTIVGRKWRVGQEGSNGYFLHSTSCNVSGVLDLATLHHLQKYWMSLLIVKMGFVL